MKVRFLFSFFSSFFRAEPPNESFIGPKYQFAKHKGIEIVTLNWLRDCVEKRIRFNEDDYRPETLKKQQQKQKQKQKQQQQQHQQQQQQQQQNREANGTILDLSEISAPSDVAPNDDEDGISISSTVKVQKRTRTSDSGNKGKEEKVLTPPESKKKKNKKRKNPFEDFLFIHDGFEEDDQVALSNEIERRGGRVMNFRKGMEIVEKRRSSSTKGKFFQQSSWEPLYLVCPHGHSLALDNYPIVTPSVCVFFFFFLRVKKSFFKNHLIFISFSGLSDVL